MNDVYTLRKKVILLDNTTEVGWKAPWRATEWSSVPHGLGHSKSPEIENASGFPISFLSFLSNKTPVFIPGHDHTHSPKQGSISQPHLQGGEAIRLPSG